MRRLICLVCVLCGLTTIQARQRQSFDADWLFILADSVGMSGVDYDDSAWRHLNVPHDWAIEGDFYVGNPSGASGGALPGGVGWLLKNTILRFLMNNVFVSNKEFNLLLKALLEIGSCSC